jgi:aldehyde:ferredoxin oxidoreductase
MADIYGWTGRVLMVDLSTGTISHIDTTRYVPRLIGGLGVAAGIAWDELRPGTDAFDPGNMLFIMVGPLTGTLASGAGRVEVAGIAPQQRPSVFSRSGMGGHWGAELKYAGYDGVVVQGQSDKPVYLWIDDGKVEIKDAQELWGKGTYATTAILRGIHGPQTRIVSCGQAGERLSRIAVLQTETGNAAGQGGYGAVMGAKKLKAIAVHGTAGVRIAHPEAFMEACLNASREGQTPSDSDAHGGHHNRPPYGPHYRTRKCGFCRTPCAHHLFMNVPGVTTSSVYTTARQCWGYEALSREAEIENRAITSDYGLNGWDISYGMIPWLQMCKQHGLIDKIEGLEIPVPDKPIGYLDDVVPVSAEFLHTLITLIVQRRGDLGDALADGTCYAADRLFGGAGIPLLDRIYPRHAGQTEHWVGHWGPGGHCWWPWWLPPLLQWCVDTRDPANDSTHQWTEHVQPYMSEYGTHHGPFPLEKVRAVCAKVYGNPDVGDPSVTYDPPEARAIPAIWHHNRGMIIDSLSLCDYENTRVFSELSEDGSADTALMSRLFTLATGHETSEAELDLAGERIWNILRAIDIRNHARDRRVDEYTIDHLSYPDLLGGIPLDRAKFMPMLDKYYELRGWNPANGWPTRSKLEELGLRDVANGLQAISRLG